MQTITLPHVTDVMIQDISRSIVREFGPDKIILFGSHAYGAPGPTSDIDLLIIMSTNQRPMQRAVPILQKCRPRFVAMNVLMRTPQEIADRLRAGDPFFLEIVKRGRVSYDRSLQDMSGPRLM